MDIHAMMDDLLWILDPGLKIWMESYYEKFFIFRVFSSISLGHSKSLPSGLEVREPHLNIPERKFLHLTSQKVSLKKLLSAWKCSILKFITVTWPIYYAT